MQANGIWMTVHKKDGTTKNKFVKATKKTSNTGNMNDNDLCFMLWPCNYFYAEAAAAGANQGVTSGKSKMNSGGGKNDLCCHKHSHLIR